jgi:hypothetical protein
MGLYAIIRERIRVVIVELAALVDYIIGTLDVHCILQHRVILKLQSVI